MLRVTFHHLTDDADFRISESAAVIGWGAKNCSPSEIMHGVLYVSAPAVTRWTKVSWCSRRSHVAVIEIDAAAVEGIDFITLSDTETLIVNLAVATVASVTERDQP